MFLVFRLILYTRTHTCIWYSGGMKVKYAFTPSVLKCTEEGRSYSIFKLHERNTGLMLHFDCQSCSDFCVRHRVAMCYGAHSASYLMAVGVTFAEGKDNVELYSNFPYIIEVCA